LRCAFDASVSGDSRTPSKANAIATAVLKISQEGEGSTRDSQTDPNFVKPDFATFRVIIEKYQQTRNLYPMSA
jgi:hypothetical protein